MSNLTKQAIKTSFMKLLEETPITKITVRAIVEDCGVNRNSFYYHYQDVPDLVEEIIKDDIDALITHYPHITSLRECVNVVIHYALDHKRAILHIYNSANRIYFEQNLMKLCKYLVESYCNEGFEARDISEYDRAIVVRILKCQLFGLIIDWIERGMPEEAIAETLRAFEMTRNMLERVRENAKREIDK